MVDLAGQVKHFLKESSLTLCCAQALVNAEKSKFEVL